MSKEISKNLKVLVMRNGIEVVIEGDKLKKIEEILQNIDKHVFIGLEDRTINTADLTGVYLPQDLIEIRLKKQGYWKCEYGIWHPKGQEGENEHEKCVMKNLNR